MGRRRKPRTRKQRGPDPEAVLAGREEVDAEALVRLIHLVNPTGRELEERQERRLYDQKSRLQSLLVRRFSELVVVVACEQEGVVSLRHRGGTLDACHAVLDELEPDARAWVRRQLDLAALPAAPEADPARPEASAEAGGEPPDALVVRAERALADYEYDVAEACLVRALEQSGGTPEAALPLLELRVELLGTDAEALALEPRLNARARESNRVRSLLALAAARLGEDERALLLVRGLPSGQSAEVYAALTHAAAQRRDQEAAERFLAETARIEPPHPRLEELRSEVAQLVADNARPDEERLAERHRRHGALAVEAEARALLESWSESAVARLVLHEAAELKRRQQVAEALEHAEAALAAERFHDAERHFREALEAGGERTDLEPRATEARRRAEEQDEENDLAALARAFESSDDHAALLAYLALPGHLRERARRAIGRPSLAWLEEAGAPSSGRHAHDAVAAVSALERVVGARDDPQAIVDELAPHRKILLSVDTARRLLEDAEERIAAARRHGAREALEQARQAADEERLDELARHLADVDAAVLDSAGRSLLEELRKRHRRGEAYARLVRKYEHAVDAWDPLSARDHALELVEAAESESTRRYWREQVAEQREEVRARWYVEVDLSERPLSELRDFRPPLLYQSNEVWLDDEGGEMILADVKGYWLFIRVVDVRRERLVERVSLQVSFPMQPPVTVWREGGVVRLIDKDGAFFEIARDGWEVLREVELEEKLLTAGMYFREVIPVPGSPYVWCELNDLGGERIVEETTRILDLESLRFERQPAASPKALLLRPEGPQVVCADEDVRLFSARGVEVPRWKFPREVRLSGVPGGLLSVEKGPEKSLSLRLLRPGGAAGKALKVTDCSFENGVILATHREGELAHLLLVTPENRVDLLALALAGPAENGEAAPPPEELYRVPFPWDVTFVQDRWGRQLHAVQLGTDCFHVVPMGPTAPDPRSVGPPIGTSSSPRPPAFAGPHACEAPDSQDSRPFLAELRWEEAHQRESLRALLEGQPYRVVSNLLYQRRINDEAGLEEFLRQTLDTRPEAEHDEPSVALRYALAVLASDEGRWDEVRDALSRLDPKRLHVGLQQHYHHLLGLSLLAAGRFEEARKVLTEGEAAKAGVCRFHDLVELIEVLEAGELTDEQSAVDQPLLWQLWGAIQAAERARLAGDPFAVVACLDRPVVWTAREVQSAARLAAAWLEIKPETPAQVFDKRQAVAFFQQVHAEVGMEKRSMSDHGEFKVNLVLGPSRRSLDVAPLAWDSDRITELNERVRNWLI